MADRHCWGLHVSHSTSAGYNDRVIWFREEGRRNISSDRRNHFIESSKTAGNLGSATSRDRITNEGDAAMLVEKFVLMLESLIRTQGQTHSDGSPKVVSTSPHIPIQLPTQSRK
jgi:hypothetical protein